MHPYEKRYFLVVYEFNKDINVLAKGNIFLTTEKGKFLNKEILAEEISESCKTWVSLNNLIIRNIIEFKSVEDYAFFFASKEDYNADYPNVNTEPEISKNNGNI